MNVMIATVALSLVCLQGLEGQEGSTLSPLPAAEFSVEHARHLLMRAGFGGTPKQVQSLSQMGLEAAANYLVDYENLSERLPGHRLQPAERSSPKAMRKLSQEERRKINGMRRREDNKKLAHLRSWWIRRMLQSERPLEEKMTLFLNGHFTTGYRDVRNAYHLAIQNDLYRAHATGNLGELVHLISRDPAMLEYLDNNRNMRRSPNENYARELLELFTLGEGNYTEEDIKAAARSFTGWTFRRGASQFVFVPRNHDYGAKVFLGQEGNFNGNDILRIILEQEQAARHLAKQLLTFFAVEPTAEELDPYARLLRETNYELKPFFRGLFKSEWFYSDRVRSKQVKSPVMLVVSTLRMLGVTGIQPPEAVMLSGACGQVGQMLFQPPNVKGWEGGPAWVTSSNLLSRYNISSGLLMAKSAGRLRNRSRNQQPEMQAEGEEPAMDRRPLDDDLELPKLHFDPLEWLVNAKVKSAEQILQVLQQRFLIVELSADRRQALLDFLRGQDGSPALDMRNKRKARVKLRELLHLITTTPEFQLC